MSDVSSSIPVIDVSNIGLQRKPGDIDKETLKAIGKELRNALSKYGVCYLQNHGIDQGFVERYLAVAKDFFNLAEETKMRYHGCPGPQFGYYPSEHETLNTERPGDLKESFNYHPEDNHDGEFHKANREFFDLCQTFGDNVLDALSLALGLEQNFMRDCHRHTGTMDNFTCLRTLFYPPVPTDMPIKHNQVRLGEHSDYGTVSFLFQDDVGGLDVKMPDKGLVPVTPIPGTIVVLAGDLLQRWTDGELVAIKHMVNLPEDELKRMKYRQSVVFFINPDKKCLVKPLNGSDRYQPVYCNDYINAQINAATGLTY